MFDHWNESQAARPQGTPPFLQDEVIVEACRYAGLPQEITNDAVAQARAVRADPEMLKVAWHCHWRLFQDPSFDRREVRGWSALETRLAEETGAFCLMLAVSGISVVRKKYEKLGIPRDVVEETLGDITVWVNEHRRRTQRVGLRLVGLGWLMNHMHGKLFRLGRLQFAPGIFQGRLRIFRHVRDGRVIALAEDGVRFRPDGQVDGAGGVYAGSEGVEARLGESEEDIEGIPVHPEGRAVLTRLRLRKSEWTQVLGPGDSALHIHIPEGEPLDFDACGRSLAEALTFFPRYLPEQSFVAFSCGAWLLDAQFATLLPAHSNIVRFQQEFYLYPIRSTSQSALERVFGTGSVDPRTAPRDTTVRRVILEHLERGGHFRGGGCFLLKDDLDWGSQVYRSQTLPFQEITA